MTGVPVVNSAYIYDTVLRIIDFQKVQAIYVFACQK